MGAKLCPHCVADRDRTEDLQTASSIRHLVIDQPARNEDEQLPVESRCRHGPYSSCAYCVAATATQHGQSAGDARRVGARAKAAPAAARQGLQAPWREYFSERYGIPYYWNPETGESRWEHPTLVQLCRQYCATHYWDADLGEEHICVRACYLPLGHEGSCTCRIHEPWHQGEGR